MKVTDIAFVVYAVTDLPRARRFYEEVLGLTPTQTFIKGDMGMIEYDIGAGTLAIGAGAPLFRPNAHGGVVSLEVDDFDGALRRLKDCGVTFRMEACETPVCRMAIIADPDDNTLMIHQRKN